MELKEDIRKKWRCAWPADLKQEMKNTFKKDILKGYITKDVVKATLRKNPLLHTKLCNVRNLPQFHSILLRKVADTIRNFFR